MMAPARSLIEGDDCSVGVLTVRFELIRACAEVKGPEAFARLHGFDELYISEVIKGHTEPSVKLLAVLGYERVTRYRRKGE